MQSVPLQTNAASPRAGRPHRHPRVAPGGPAPPVAGVLRRRCPRPAGPQPPGASALPARGGAAVRRGRPGGGGWERGRRAAGGARAARARGPRRGGKREVSRRPADARPGHEAALRGGGGQPAAAGPGAAEPGQGRPRRAQPLSARAPGRPAARRPAGRHPAGQARDPLRGACGRPGRLGPPGLGVSPRTEAGAPESASGLSLRAPSRARERRELPAGSVAGGALGRRAGLRGVAARCREAPGEARRLTEGGRPGSDCGEAGVLWGG